MAQDNQQATVTLKAQLDKGFNKAFGDAFKQVDLLNKKVKTLDNSLNHVGKANVAVAATQNTFNTAVKKNIDLVTGQEIAVKKTSSSFKNLVGGIASATAAYIGFQAVLGFGSAIVRNNAEFASSFGELKAVLQGTSFQDLQRLQKTAMELGTTTLFNPTQVIEGMNALAKAGFDANQVLASIPATLNLATAGGIELGQAAEVTADTMAQFGITGAAGAERIADVFSKAAAQSTIDVTDLVESMKFLGPTASNLGSSLEEVSALTGLFGLSGLKGGIATRAFATSLGTLADPTKSQRDALSRANVNVFEGGKFIGLTKLFEKLEKNLAGRSDQERLDIVSNIFGAEAAKSAIGALKLGTPRLKEFIAELENARGFSKEFAEIKSDNLSGDLRKLDSAFKAFTIKIGEVFEPTLRGAVQGLTGVFVSLTNIMESFKQPLLAFQGLFGIKGLHKDYIEKQKKEQTTFRTSNTTEFDPANTGFSNKSANGISFNTPINIVVNTNGSFDEQSQRSLVSAIQRTLLMENNEILNKLNKATTFTNKGSTY